MTTYNVKLCYTFYAEYKNIEARNAAEALIMMRTYAALDLPEAVALVPDALRRPQDDEVLRLPSLPEVKP